MKTNEEYRLAAFRHFQHERDVTPADITDKALSLMLDDLERKAWECSVEMMDESFKNSEMAEDPKCTRKDKYNGLASGWKYAAYKLREAFGFPKSETPDRFKTKCQICEKNTVANGVCSECTDRLCKPFDGEV